MSPSHAIEDYLHVRRWDRRQTQSNEEAQPHLDVSVRSNFQLYLDGPAVQLQAIDRSRVTEVRWRLASLPLSFLRPSVPLIAHALWTHRGFASLRFPLFCTLAWIKRNALRSQVSLTQCSAHLQRSVASCMTLPSC